MSEREVKIQADVNKIVDLFDNNVLSKDESTKILKQFDKTDLINSLLDEGDLEDEDNTSDEDFVEKKVEEKIKEGEVKEVIKDNEPNVEDLDNFNDEDDEFLGDLD